MRHYLTHFTLDSPLQQFSDFPKNWGARGAQDLDWSSSHGCGVRGAKVAVEWNKKSHRSLFPQPQLKRLLLLALLLSLGGLILTPTPKAIAQERAGCFLKTKSGRYINLNSICIFPEPTLERTAISSGTPGVYQAKIVRRNQGIPVIEVVFNENQSFEMMVDTGASATVITPVMAEMLGVIPTGRGLADTPSQKNAEFEIGLVRSVDISGARSLNLPVAIAPALDMGLLGQDFFSQYDVTIKEDVIEFRERS